MPIGIPDNSVFTSVRERRLWVWTLLVMVAIYSTLGPARSIASALRQRNLLAISIIIVLFVILGYITNSWFKNRPDWREIGVAIAVIFAYLMIGVRIESWEERTHLIEYGVVAALIHEALRERIRNGKKIQRSALIAVLATAFLGTIDECIQAFLPNRVFDFRDIFFNVFAGFMVVAARLAIGTQNGYGWRLWFLWLMSAAYGWGLAVSVTGLGEISLLTNPERYRDAGVGVIVSGMVVGIFQWLILRGKIRQSYLWIPASLASAFIYSFVLYFLYSFHLDNAWMLGTATMGLLLGTFQCLVLKKSVHRAGWWILASTAGWLLGMPAGQEVGWNGLGAVYGVVTGLVLVWLLRNEKTRTENKTRITQN